MSTALDHLRPVASPSRIGQATAVEQSRAIAQVQAMVVVAQQFPRSVPSAIRAMEEACQQIELAEQAFFSYPRAGQTVTGPSVHLARELARCWGNIEHGVSELRRDDAAAESEMQAFAWDLEVNMRSSSTFIVPHKMDTKKGVKDLVDMRDIYENNANNGARRLREAIFSTLPVWFRERAMRICRETLDGGGGKPLAERIAEAVKAFERYRVSPARLAAKFGYADVGELTGHDVGQLGIIYESLRQGTVQADEEFAPEQPRVTAADITGRQPEAKAQPRRGRQQAKEEPADRPSGAPSASASEEGSASGAPAPAPDAPSENQPPDDPPASTGQVGKIQGHMRRLGYAGDEPEERDARLGVVARLARLPRLESTTDLSSSEAARVIRALDMISDRAQLDALLADGEVPGGE
jgi:hypothetical protein